jgi:hypothetical protein
MNPAKRIAEQLQYFWKNRFSDTTTRVLAYCAPCMDEGNQVPLESILTKLEQETRHLQTEKGRVDQMREHYKHIITCRDGHEVINSEYWTQWEPIPPVIPFPG